MWTRAAHRAFAPPGTGRMAGCGAVPHPAIGLRVAVDLGRAGYGRLNSCVCGFRCGRRMAPPVVEPLSRKMCTPLVISDS